MCEIDNRLLSAMSTQNLVRSCYIYPYNGEIIAYDSPYASFLDEIHYVWNISTDIANSIIAKMLR